MHGRAVACVLWCSGGVLGLGMAPAPALAAAPPSPAAPVAAAAQVAQRLTDLPIRRLPVELQGRAPALVVRRAEEEEEADRADGSPLVAGAAAPAEEVAAEAGTLEVALERRRSASAADLQGDGEPGGALRQPSVAELLAAGADSSRTPDAGPSAAAQDASAVATSGPFDVRIVAPGDEAPVAGRVRVRADVMTEQPEAVRAVDFIVDGRLLFSDSEPPYELIWNAGRPAAHRIEVRAYGAGRRIASDALDLADPAAPQLDSLAFSARVERVEVYVRVEDEDGRTPDLAPGAFEVLEEGTPQPVLGVEPVSELALAIGLVVDCSGSMVARLDRALEAAGVFVEGLIRQAQDKAFVMAFSDLPTLMQGFTNDVERLTGSLSMMRSGRYTALYDSVVAAAQGFDGVEGRRAIVLLTDGHDQGSDHRLDEAIAAAQRADVVVYPVAVDVSSRFIRERWILSRMAEATGGRVWHLDLRGDPSSIYESIADDLRSQFRITYAPRAPGGSGEWRAIEVRVRDDDADRELRVRARPGYYAR